MHNDTHLNVLFSFAYLAGAKRTIDRVIDLCKQGTINLMIDSGAFTAYNARGKYDHINVDSYCEFLEVFKNYCDKYVMLDVIRNAKASKANYEKMLAKGLNPMFVATMYDKDFEYMRKAVGNNPDICVAGGSATKGDWMTNRFIKIYNETGQRARIHGLAYVTFPKMFQLPITSVDSASWKLAAKKFGSLCFFTENGLKNINYNDVLKGRKKLKPFQISELHRLGVTPQDFVERNFRGNNSISALLSVNANIQLQKYCKRRNLDFFLSASNLQDINQIVYVATAEKLSYKEFREI